MASKKNKIDYANIFLALFSGLLLTLSFPSTGFDLLSWLALVPLLMTLRNLRFSAGFRMGLLTGLCHYLSLLYWVVHTMKTYGHLPWYLSLGVLCLFCFYLSLYIALFSALLTRLNGKPIFLLPAIPIFWVAMEYLRASLFTGFPWEILGVSQYKRLALIQVSDLFGVYAVSFLIALANAALFLILLSGLKKSWRGHIISKRWAAGAASVFAVVFFFVWFYGTGRIESVDGIAATASRTRIAIAQGNIPQGVKWNPGFKVQTLKKYLALSHRIKQEKPNLIVWPESAAPFYYPHNRPMANFLVKGIESNATYFLIGIPAAKQHKDKTDYYNRAILFDARGQVVGIYDKAHLVPFGEYVPFRKWLPFLGKMVAQVGDFTAGEKGKTIQWRNTAIGTLICYEVIFPYLSRAQSMNDAELLINITNDAWYGRTSAPYQHFSMAVFRAVENRRALVRSANTGISGFIDPAGRILGQTGLFEDAVMSRDVPLFKIKTFYARHGDIFAATCVILSLLLMTITAVVSKKGGKA